MSHLLTSFSVTNPQQILNNPLNTSHAKFQFSFSKTESCSEAFYKPANAQDKRSAAIGYGKKSDFTKSSVVAPPPTSYQAQSIFERSSSVKRGKSFGLSRDKLSENGYIIKGPLKNPGPGEYVTRSSVKNEGYSLRKKTISLYNPVFLDGKTTFQKTPGPGSYSLGDTITKLGNQTISNFKNSCATSFNPPCSQRFDRIKSAAPGPGRYHPNNDLDLSGHYVLSQNKGNGTRVFSGENRKSFTDIYANKSFTPGPGCYRIPSDFGNYDHIDLYRTQGEFPNSANKSNSFSVGKRPNTASYS